MADDVVIPATGTGTATPSVATDEISARHHQLVKVEFGVADSATMVSASNPLPVVQTGTPALPTGAALDSSVQSVLTGVGAPTDAAATTTGSVIAQLRRIANFLAGTLTVSGTVTTSPPSNASTNVTQFAGTAAQSGHGLAANALRVELPTDGTGVVGITGTVPLPTGAATAAKQPGIGTAGSANADVISVQGITSGTPLNVAGTFSASGTTDLTASGTLTAAGSVTLSGMNGMSVAQIDVTGTIGTMTVILEASVDGTNFHAQLIGLTASSTTGTLTNGNALSVGNFITPVAGLSAIRARCTVGTGAGLVIAIRASAAPAVVQLGASLPPGTNLMGKVGIDQSVSGTTNFVVGNISQIAGSAVATAATGIAKVGLTDALGNATNAAGSGFLKVTDEPTQVFYDPFDAAPDTTNTWTSTQGSSGVAASVTTGVLSMGTGTVANGYSKLISIPTFKPTVPGWVVYSDAIALPDGASVTANSYRFWGAGTTPATPTAASPVTDGYGFEMTTAGHLCCVVWAGGVRTLIADLNGGAQPVNANYHRYIIQVRTDKTFFYIDTIDSAGLVATTSFQSPQIQTLPKLFLCVGGATPPGSNTQIQCTGAVVSDTGKNASQIADATFPWRKAAVDTTGALATTPKLGTAAAGFQITATTSPATLIAANANRKGLVVLNHPSSSQVVLIGPATVSSTTGIAVYPGQTLNYAYGEGPTNLLQCISTASTALLIVQEIT